MQTPKAWKIFNPLVLGFSATFLGLPGLILAAQPSTCQNTPWILHGSESVGLTFQDQVSHWISFNACLGRTYILQTFDLGSLADTVLEVYAVNCGSMLASDDNGGGGAASRIVWTAPGSGTFHVKVRQADGSTGGDRTFELVLTGDTSPCSLWMKCYGTSLIDPLNGIQWTYDGGLLLEGIQYDPGSPGPYTQRAWMMKLDGAGALEWQKNLSGPGAAVTNASNLAPYDDGRFGLILSPSDPEGIEYTGRLMTADPAGAVAGNGTLGGYLYEPIIRLIAPAGDGGLIAAGYYWDMNFGLPFRFVGKLNAASQWAWMNVQQTNDPSWPTTLTALADGSVLATRTVSNDIWMIRFSSAGAFVWQRTLGGSGSDSISGVQALADGGFLLAGSTASWGAGGPDAWLVRMDAAGQILWERTYGTAGSEAFYSVNLLHDGTVAAAGSFAGALWVARLSADGTLLGQRTYGVGPGRILEAPDGGFLAVSSTSTLGAGLSDVLLLKMDGSGQVAGACAAPAETAAVTGTSAAVNPSGSNPFSSGGISATSAPCAWGSSWNAVPTPVCGVALPLEVSSTASVQPMRLTDRTHLEWESAAASGSSAFNLYRGTPADLLPGGALPCLQRGLGSNSTDDPETPPAGTFWVYLVSGTNELGEGPLGFDTAGNPRPRGAACP